MPVELSTLQQIIHLPPDNMIDLIETVGHAAQMNIPLRLSEKDKILVACIMLNHAGSMLEQCGCKLNIKIINHTWTEPIIYNTTDEENPHIDLGPIT